MNGFKPFKTCFGEKQAELKGTKSKTLIASLVFLICSFIGVVIMSLITSSFVEFLFLVVTGSSFVCYISEACYERPNKDSLKKQAWYICGLGLFLGALAVKIPFPCYILPMSIPVAGFAGALTWWVFSNRKSQWEYLIVTMLFWIISSFIIMSKSTVISQVESPINTALYGILISYIWIGSLKLNYYLERIIEKESLCKEYEWSFAANMATLPIYYHTSFLVKDIKRKFRKEK